MNSYSAFEVQTWAKDGASWRKLNTICDLSIDAAREIAKAHMAAGCAYRISSQTEDYTEVDGDSHGFRVGRFAETTYVTC